MDMKALGVTILSAKQSRQAHGRLDFQPNTGARYPKHSLPRGSFLSSFSQYLPDRHLILYLSPALYSPMLPSLSPSHPHQRLVLSFPSAVFGGLQRNQRISQVVLVIKNPSSPPVQETERLGFNPLIREIPWRRAWQPTPVFLLRESHGQRSLEGYSPQSQKELGTTEATWHTEKQNDA